MASDNETVAEAIEAVRKMIHDCPAIKGGMAEFGYQLKANGAIDRVEAAHNREIAELRRRLKVAEDALNYVMTVAAIEEAWSNTSSALAAMREEGCDPCNAKDGEGSSLRIGWEGEKEYCVVAKYRQDLQVELEDYDYHRVTGPLPLDIAKHWLDHHERIRTKSEDPKILVREVSKWRLFDEAKEGGAK